MESSRPRSVPTLRKPAIDQQENVQTFSMAKRLIPLLDRVLVEKLKPVNKSIGGVLLPDTATHRVRHLKMIICLKCYKLLTLPAFDMHM